MAFYVPIRCVRFARYCGKMYSRHLFPYGGLGTFICLFILFILLRLGVTYIKNIEGNYKTRQGHHNSKNQFRSEHECRIEYEYIFKTRAHS